MTIRKPKTGESLGDKKPKLASEWHPSKNEGLTPFDFSPKSGYKAWWKCPKGDDHEWPVKIAHRTDGSGCPFCSGRKPSSTNNLAALNPKLAEEWHPTKNGPLTPFDFLPNSNKKVWWKCPKGEDHVWDATIAHRNNGKGCSICSGHKVAKSTSLATLYPDIASSWHPTKNEDLTPFDVSPGSHKEVWWKCDKGDDHEWPSIVSNRTKGSGCPVCVNQIVVPSNSLATVKPNLAKEWHQTKNGSLTPNDITFGSNKNVWWQCNKGHDHVWETSPSHRNQGNGCPFCKNPSSGPELRIYCELKAIFSNVLHRTKIDGFEVDILIPDLKIGIEYDGEFWHRNKEKQDLKKNQALAKKIILIRIRDKGLDQLTDNDILQPTRNVTVKTIKLILERILDLQKIKSKEIIDNIDNYLKDNKWINPNQFRKLRAARHHIDFKDSITFLFPEIAKEWHPTKNSPLKPEYFLPGSNKKVWWKCEKGPDHEWEASIASRCQSKTGCSICSNYKVVNSNCLATLYPNLIKEWDDEKNGILTPYDVTPVSYKEVWWVNKNDESWEEKIRSRVKSHKKEIENGQMDLFKSSQ